MHQSNDIDDAVDDVAMVTNNQKKEACFNIIFLYTVSATTLLTHQ